MVTDTLRAFDSQAALARQAEDEPATTAQRFIEGPPQLPAIVKRLANRLRTGDNESKVGRISTAYELGRADAARLSQPTVQVQSDARSSSQRSPVYIVLLGAGAPFVTSSYDTYLSAAQPQGVIDPWCYSRILTTQSEADAYLAGLGAEPPLPTH